MPISTNDLIAGRYRVGSPIDAETYEAVDELLHRRVLVAVDNEGVVDDDAHILDGGVHDGTHFRVLAVFEGIEHAEIDDVEDATAAMSPVVEATAMHAVVTAPPVARRRASPWPVIAGVAVAIAVLVAVVFALGRKDADRSVDPAVTTTIASTSSTVRERPRVTAPAVTDPPTTEARVETPTTEPTPPPTDPPATDAPLDTAP